MEELYPQDPADAVDRPSVLKSVAGYIIVTEFCERLAYYGFAGSLVLFFQVTYFTHKQINYDDVKPFVYSLDTIKLFKCRSRCSV